MWARAVISAPAAAAYGDAQRTILALMRADKLGESELGTFARNGQFEHAVAALSALSRIPIEVVERLMRIERPDALIVLCRAIGIEWTTVRAIIAACGMASRTPSIARSNRSSTGCEASSAARIAALTVITQSIRVARTHPVVALRYE